MPKLVIDNREVEVADGATILDAAGALGIEIPTLCFLPGMPVGTSCMVCVVKLAPGGLVPACGALATEGMVVESDTDEVRQARREALELLLGDHVGDCDAPCQVICPAGLHIPRMLRRIAAGEPAEAVAIARDALVLPGVLGRICSAPCQRGCRRVEKDSPIAIRLLHRFAAEAVDAALPACESATGKSVAIVGAGPAGLAAAQVLLRRGHACTIFDERTHPGGSLRNVDEAQLPRDVLDGEIAMIAGLGVEFRCGVRVGRDVSPGDLTSGFDAVIYATGKLEAPEAEKLGLAMSDRGVTTDAAAGVFAAGAAVAPRKLAVSAIADGKAAAESVNQFLAGEQVTGPAKRFNSRMGKLLDGEIARFGSPGNGQAVAADRAEGVAQREAVDESKRCLHCDCRRADDCKLRDLSGAYGATQHRPPERRLFEADGEHPEIIYESGKCIACGLCIKVAAEAGEELGLTFIGRGYDVRVAVPFDQPLSAGLKISAADCVKACPTGALAFKAGD